MDVNKADYVVRTVSVAGFFRERVSRQGVKRLKPVDEEVVYVYWLAWFMRQL